MMSNIKKTNNLKSIFKYVSIFLLIIFVFFIGVYAGYAKRPWIERVSGVEHKNTEVVTSVDFGPFWKAWNIINEKSPDRESLTDQKKVYGAIQGLIGSLDDPYSTFFPPEENKQFGETLNNKFSGVGMEVGIKDKVLTVISPIKGSPAEKNGIKSGDKILKIDEDVTTNLTIDQAIKKIRGEVGTKVKLSIYREGTTEPLNFEITRDIINIPSMDGKIRPDGVYVISIYNFGNETNAIFKNEIEKFVKSNTNKLILDLRGNPGGILDGAVDVSSYFLPQGKLIVSEDFGKNKEIQSYRSRGYVLPINNLKIAILVDEGSASASEIVTGALQENGVARVFGTQTYGKGSVQELIPLTKDTSIKITVAKWLTPKGNSISKKGITPDVEVKLTKEDLDKKYDRVLEKASLYLLDK